MFTIRVIRFPLFLETGLVTEGPRLVTPDPRSNIRQSESATPADHFLNDVMAASARRSCAPTQELEEPTGPDPSQSERSTDLGANPPVESWNVEVGSWNAEVGPRGHPYDFSTKLFRAVCRQEFVLDWAVSSHIDSCFRMEDEVWATDPHSADCVDYLGPVMNDSEPNRGKVGIIVQGKVHPVT